MEMMMEISTGVTSKETNLGKSKETQRATQKDWLMEMSLVTPKEMMTVTMMGIWKEARSMVRY
jgi:hypothetical protein